MTPFKEELWLNIFSSLVDGIRSLLNFFYNFTDSLGFPNYGIAIILLTIVVKMALYPLTVKQMKSMKAMQVLQPKIKEIQEKQKDPQKAQQAIMTLYKENGANPLSGCLPLLIQMPILIALYQALNNFPYANPAHAKFLWVTNLSVPDPFYGLAILSGATTYVLQKMTTNTADQTQKTMLTIMPIFIGWMSTNFPAGLALYWVVLNLVGIAQQYFINKNYEGAPVMKGEIKENEGSGKNRKDH